MSITSTATKRSIRQTFEQVRARGQIGLVPFIPAGYPDISMTPVAIKALDSAGAAAIEIGFPFSDPVADGPTIQEAFTAALAKKLKVSQIFQAVQSVSENISAPLISMVSYSVVFRYGLDRFLADARTAGFSGLIIPDLPPPEAQAACEQIQAGGLETILLVSPTTTLDRRAEIARLSTGFIYYLSVSGITGERDQLPPELAAGVNQLRGITDRPICVGFGISKPSHIKALTGIADGAIVGSAIVKEMKRSTPGDPNALAVAITHYCRNLMSGANS